jgi:transposase
MERRRPRRSKKVKHLHKQFLRQRRDWKPTTTLRVRQAVCHWLLWWVLVLLVLCQPDPLTVFGCQTSSLAITPEVLLAPLAGHDGIKGCLFSWLLKHSRQRRTIRLPVWVSSLWGLWALIRQMRSWSMAQWVAFLSSSQTAKLVGGILFLYPILKELEVAEIVDAYCPTEAEGGNGIVVSALVLNRLIAPRPLYKVMDWMFFSILPLVWSIPARKFNDDRLGRTLEAIEPHLQVIWLEIITQAFEHYDIDLSVIFYDLTAFIMMGEYDDSELVDFGFAHNTPMDKRKIKLAGNASQDGGILFWWRALSGRKADTATAEKNMEQLQKVLRRYEWPEDGVLIVSDRAMLNDRLAIVYDDHKDHKLYYLSGLELRKNEHKELVAEVSLKELQEHYLMGKAGHRYWGVKRPITFTHTYEDKEGNEIEKQVTHTALVVFSEATYRSWRSKYIEQLRELSQVLQEEVKNRLNEPYWRTVKTIRKRAQARLDNSPVGEAMKVEVWGEYGDVEMRWWVDREALREMCRPKGRYLLVTDHPDLSAVEMLATYKDKDKVEKRFRVAKGVLHVRPIYLHKDERIAAMLCVNMIALLVYSLAERRCRRNGLHITGRQMLYAYGSLHVIESRFIDGSVLYQSMPLTPHQREILWRMGIEGETLLNVGEWMDNSATERRFTVPPPRGLPSQWPAAEIA